MTDMVVDRRQAEFDRRSGEDRRKIPRRFSDVYPPPNSDEWKRILFHNIDNFAERYMVSLPELGMLVNELIEAKEKHEYP